MLSRYGQYVATGGDLLTLATGYVRQCGRRGPNLNWITAPGIEVNRGSAPSRRHQGSPSSRSGSLNTPSETLLPPYLTLTASLARDLLKRIGSGLPSTSTSRFA